MKRGRILAAGASFVVLIAACAPPSPQPVPNIKLPSPSPTPTTPMAATAPTFHVGEVGLAYGAVAVTATGGVQPYKYAVDSGALPGGLNLGADGTISGTPTAGGDFAFTIAIADSGDSTIKVDGKISIAARLSASLIPYCSSYCNVELGCVNVCGSFGDVSGGVKPYAYSVTGGTLPAGTSLRADSLNLTGTFGGGAGWVQFTVQVTDALGATSTVFPRFWLYDHISLAASTTCYGNYITGCQASLAISGGIPGSGATATLVAVSPLPPNIKGCWPLNPPSPTPGSVSVSGGNLNVSIPNRIINGYGAVWTVQVVSADLCGAGQYCTSNQATVTIGVQCG